MCVCITLQTDAIDRFVSRRSQTIAARRTVSHALHRLYIGGDRGDNDDQWISSLQDRRQQDHITTTAKWEQRRFSSLLQPARYWCSASTRPPSTTVRNKMYPIKVTFDEIYFLYKMVRCEISSPRSCYFVEIEFYEFRISTKWIGTL